MPLTRDQGNALAELLCVIRPAWNTRGVITKGLVPLAKHPAPLEVIAWAAIRAARDPEVLTPAVIPLNGPHWNLADRPPTPRLTPEHECPRHVGQWAGNCPLCVSEKHTHPRDDHDDGAHLEYGDMTSREQARAIAARAKRANAGHDDDQEGDRPRRRYPPRIIAALEQLGAHLTDDTRPGWYAARYPHRQGMTPDERRRSAMHDCRPVNPTNDDRKALTP